LPSYHFSVQIIGRNAGRSAVAAAAYRAGERLRDERSGRTADFARRRGVVQREILLPPEAAAWLGNRERLWNHVEALERRSDAQLAREINLALPHELTAAQRVDLVCGFVQEQFVAMGMVADVAWHAPVAEKGDDPRNFHAHIMLTLRQAQADGLRPVKTREWNSDTLLELWRRAWSRHQNRALERAGLVERVDHRSLAEQRTAALKRRDSRAAEELDRRRKSTSVPARGQRHGATTLS
jgi:ATP-dependent exoDNAse (exonuclease V) alpha subunit